MLKPQIRSLLNYPACFAWFQNWIGAPKAKKECLARHAGLKPNTRLLDLGCGPGALVDLLPPSTLYFGIDISEKYIESAKRKYPSRGAFVCGDLNDASVLARLGKFDTCIAFGVLHHLNDSEARKLFLNATKLLHPGGRLVTLDGCFAEGQSPIARFLLKRDRGRYVRSLQGYRSLAKGIFPRIEAAVYHSLLRIPFTFAVLECSLQETGP